MTWTCLLEEAFLSEPTFECVRWLRSFPGLEGGQRRPWYLGQPSTPLVPRAASCTPGTWGNRAHPLVPRATQRTPILRATQRTLPPPTLRATLRCATTYVETIVRTGDVQQLFLKRLSEPEMCNNFSGNDCPNPEMCNNFPDKAESFQQKKRDLLENRFPTEKSATTFRTMFGEEDHVRQLPIHSCPLPDDARTETSPTHCHRSKPTCLMEQCSARARFRIECLAGLRV